MHDVAAKPDLEAIMRRLKGNKEPFRTPVAPQTVSISSNDETTNELKHIVKRLGEKLKTVLVEKQYLQNLLIEKEKEVASMQTLCDEKNEIIATLQKSQESSKQTSISPTQEEELSQLRRAQTQWAAGQEQLRQFADELGQLRKDQSEWNNEREQLLNALQNERSTKQTPSQEHSAQVLRIAMTCRELEDEIHALTCERAATLRQYREQKEAHDHLKESTEKYLLQIAAQETSLLEKEKEIESKQHDYANLNTAYKDLQNQNSHDKTEIEDLRKRIDALQTLEIELNEKLHNTHKHTKSLHDDLKSKEEAFLSLQEENSDLKASLESITDEKNKGAQRIQEVEEVLVLKLTLISELQEQIASLQAATTSLQENNASLNHALQQAFEQLNQLEAEHSTLLDTLANTKQQLQETEKNNASLIERTEKYECLLNTVRDAKEQATGLLKILENGKTPSVSVAKLVEELSTRPEEVSGILVEDRFEQHDLF
jgi:chromosome segregation ATPase